MRTSLTLVALLLAVGVCACGSDSDDRFDLRTPGTESRDPPDTGSGDPPAGKPTKTEVEVIRGWSDALRAGRVNKAARFFAVPARVFDGTNPLRDLPDRGAVREFNRGLPCGARLVGTQRGADASVIATFRLTKRPGSDCGPGTGEQAWTAFVIRDHLIVQWLRVPEPSSADGGPQLRPPPETSQG
jgi:hypothetical protein